MGKKLELTNRAIDMVHENIKKESIFNRILSFLLGMDGKVRFAKQMIKHFDNKTIVDIQEEIKGYEKTKRKKELDRIG